MIFCVNFRTPLFELELVEYGLLLSILGNIFLSSRNSLDLGFGMGFMGEFCTKSIFKKLSSIELLHQICSMA